jgi:hypothetical protein
MDHTKIADLIHNVYISYGVYEETFQKINYHYELTNSLKDRQSDEDKIELKFESFDESYLRNYQEFWLDKSDKLILKYRKLYYEVDSEDFK